MGILRVLLALSVITYHSRPLLGTNLVAEIAVPSFFIVSGFYMALILNGKYKVAGTWLFFKNRALRLYPTYFLILAFVLASDGVRWFLRGEPSRALGAWYNNFGEMSVGTIIALAFTNLTFFGSDALSYLSLSPASGSFIHNTGIDAESGLDFQIIRQSWSLGVEVLFYSVAPFLVRLRTLHIVLVSTACFVGRFAILGQFGEPSYWWQSFFLINLPLFLVGAIGYRWTQYVDQNGFSFRGISEVSVALIIVATIFYRPFHIPPALYYLFIVGLAPFLFRFSNTYRWDRVIGDLSYSMYLLHWVILQYIWQIIDRVPTWSFTLICSIVTMIGAALIWVFLERPIDRFRQKRVKRRVEEVADNSQAASIAPTTMKI